MRANRPVSFLLAAVTSLAVSASGCSDDTSAGNGAASGEDAQQGTDADSDAATAVDDIAAVDTLDPTPDALPEDAPDSAAVLPIAEALTCGTKAEVGGVPKGTELARHDLDTTIFPDALCNDGSPAVLYFRPFEGEENRNKWVIQLKGGGSCRSADDCAQRWCSILTNFGKTQMVADIQPVPSTSAGAKGILDRTEASNPFAGYNHVFVNYCSSDLWTGTARDVVADAHVPCDPTLEGATCPDGSACPGSEAGFGAGSCTGSPIQYRIHFLGSRIVDAVIGTLRQAGVPALVKDGVALPDLDAAAHVVLAGASAGGAGVAHNLDRIADVLRKNNDVCTAEGGAEDCPLVVDGLIDSIYSPSTEDLDFEESRFCTELGACTWEAFQQGQWAIDQDGLWNKAGDASCEAWHAANEPGSEWHCAETSHVIAHHVTTPFFLRMGLTDSLISSSLLSMNLYVGEEEPFDTLLEFATLLQPQLVWFSGWAAEAEEGSDAHASPGVFAPACNKHETISSGPDVYETTIEVAGTPRHFFDVWNFWKAGGAVPAVVISTGVQGTVCSSSPDE